jgi:hypothetical protein
MTRSVRCFAHMTTEGKPSANGARGSGGPWPYLPWLLPALAVLAAPLQVNDLAYQLRAGRIMWAQHAILRTDGFTYTISGAAWLNQQWGAQVILWGWFWPFGWKGLVALQALLVAASYGLTYRAAAGKSAAVVVAAAASLIGFATAVAVPGALAMRPQLLALPLFALSGWIVRNRSQTPRMLLAIPLVGIVWANLHGSFVLLPVLLAIALAADVVDKSPRLRLTALVLAISLVCPLVTPWGLSVYGYVWRLATDPIVRTIISEWQPILAQPSGVPFGVFCFAASAALWRRRSRLPTVEEALTIIVFTALTLFSARNVVWWSVAIPPAVCGALAGWSPGGAWGRSATWVAIGAVAAGIVLASIRLATSSPADIRTEAPTGITAWLADRPATERIFAEWWAPWFEYALPDRPMFTDARVELFPDRIWHDYFDVVDAQPNWQEQLNGWAIDTVVIASGHHPELVEVLSKDPGWRLAYQDADGMVFIRS